MVIHTGIAVFVVFLVGLLFGYMTGKKSGMKISNRRARAAAALELRQESLRDGVCPTCDRSAEDMVQYGIKG
ncbi:hypothetical protein [Alicyclobacillus sp. SO9]|uniref:hypothetical protein n=1 Tax=Alicyclobacillus sp. SO9 TaxID=2665646 RepID=UPI0018E8F54D|nr:hypothetical protein [Alicyclobacillus sp. SO9]QQE80976.1 hypothetical protein GI364_11695 [Alicyclobacillus sp. SO9]